MKLARLQLAIGLLFVLLFVAFAGWARFPVPYRDDWDWLREHLTRPLTFRTLFEPHNEHLIPLTRLLFALQYQIDKTGGHLLFAIALGAQLAMGCVFWRQIRARWPRDRVMQSFTCGLVLVCLYFTYQLQSIVFVAAILFPLVQMFVVLACASAAVASADGSSDDRPARRTLWWTAAVMASLGAALTTTNGLIVPAVVALYTLVSPHRGRAWIAFAALQALCVLSYVAFVGQPWRHAPAPAGDRWAVMSLESMAVFFLAFFSSGLTYGGTSIGLWLGAGSFAAGCWCVWTVVRDRRRSPQIERFAAGLLLFTIASAAMTTVGRAQIGILQAAQSRYATFTLVYWSALIVWALSRADGRESWLRWKRRVMTIGVACTAIGLVVQVFVGLVWAAKTENLSFAALTLATGVDDDQWVATLHPETHHVYEVRVLLQADRSWNLEHARIGSRLEYSAASTCEGNMTLLPAVPGPGWRLDGTLDARDTLAYVRDGGGTIVGLARKAPIVNEPNPMQIDVLAAVWRNLLSSSPPTPRWGGFARSGLGAPYTLHVEDAQGQPHCQIALSISSTL